MAKQASACSRLCETHSPLARCSRTKNAGREQSSLRANNHPRHVRDCLQTFFAVVQTRKQTNLKVALVVAFLFACILQRRYTLSHRSLRILLVQYVVILHCGVRSFVERSLSSVRFAVCLSCISHTFRPRSVACVGLVYEAEILTVRTKRVKRPTMIRTSLLPPLDRPHHELNLSQSYSYIASRSISTCIVCFSCRSFKFYRVVLSRTKKNGKPPVETQCPRSGRSMRYLTAAKNPHTYSWLAYSSTTVSAL